MWLSSSMIERNISKCKETTFPVIAPLPAIARLSLLVQNGFAIGFFTPFGTIVISQLLGRNNSLAH